MEIGEICGLLLGKGWGGGRAGENKKKRNCKTGAVKCGKVNGGLSGRFIFTNHVKRGTHMEGAQGGLTYAKDRKREKIASGRKTGGRLVRSGEKDGE